MALIIPINGQTASAFSPDDVHGLIYKFAEEIYTGADIEVQYPEFERTVQEWGGILGDVRVPPATGYAIQESTTSICGPYYFDVDALYYQTWDDKIYWSEYRTDMLERVFNGQTDFNIFMSHVLQRNVEGWRADINKSIESALVKEATTGPAETLVAYDSSASTLATAIMNSVTYGWLKSTSRIEVLDNPTWEKLYSEIAAKSLDMTRTNLSYIGKSAGSVGSKNTIGFGNRMSDLIIMIPDELYAYADVTYIQTLERLSGLDKLPQIKPYNGKITLDNGTTGYPVIIMDKRVLNHITRKQRAVENYVACRDSQQIGLFKSDMVRYLPYYKAYAIVTPMPESSTSTVGIRSALYSSTGISVGQNVGNVTTYTSRTADATGRTATAAITMQQDVASIKNDAADTADVTTLIADRIPANSIGNIATHVASIDEKTPEPTA